MMSHSEIRQAIEYGFAPTRCVCKITPDNMMTISLYRPGEGIAALTATHLDTSVLTTFKAIANLVIRLRGEFDRQQLVQSDRRCERG